MRSILAEKFRQARSSPLVQEVGVTYSGQVLGSGIGFVIQILLQRVLGPADYGILALAVSVGSLTAVVSDLGISHAMVRYGSKYLAEEPGKAMPRFTAALLLRLILTACVTLVGFSSARMVAVEVFDKPELAGPLSWIYLGMIGGTLYGYWMFFIQTFQRFTLRSAVTVVTAVIRLSAFLAIWALAVLTPTSMIMLDAAVNLAGFLIGMTFSPRGLLKGDGKEIKAAMVEIVSYCRNTGILIVGDTIFNELDTFMLGAFKSEEVVGLYRAAWTYAMMLGFLNMSVSNVLFPKVTSVSDIAKLRAFVRRILKFTGLLAVCTLPALPLVSWWIPWYEVSYSGAVTIFYIMYVGLVFELIVGPLGYVLYSLDRPGVMASIAVGKIVVNAAGNFLLIPAYGAHGAAIATITTRLVGGLVTVWIVTRTLRRRGG